MPDRTAVALALASAAFVSIPLSLIPHAANAQAVRRRVGRRVPRRQTGPFWEVVLGPAFSDGRARGFLAGGVTYQMPLGATSTWGVHAQGGFSYGQNYYDQTDHQLSAQAVLFARDPMIGEIGVLAGFTKFSDTYKNNVTNYGVEGEYYFNRVTVGGAIGIQSVDNQSRWVAQAGVSVYPTDNLKLTLSGLYDQNNNAGAAFGVEYQPGGGFFYIPGTETVLFAKASYSEDVAALRAGLRVQFGGAGGSLFYADRYQRKNFYGSMLGSEGISVIDNVPFK